MSQWTHVSGLIRVDGLEILGDDIRNDVQEAFGNTVSFEDGENKWDECDAPCGSEGSIQYRVDRTGTENSMSWGVVYIWGDIRDYNDAEEIYSWVKGACEKLWVRQCSVKVSVESGKSYLIHDVYDLEKMESSFAMIEIT